MDIQVGDRVGFKYCEDGETSSVVGTVTNTYDNKYSSIMVRYLRGSAALDRYMAKDRVGILYTTVSRNKIEMHEKAPK